MLIAVWMDRDGTLDKINYSDMASLNETMLDGNWSRLPDNIIELDVRGIYDNEFTLEINRAYRA